MNAALDWNVSDASFDTGREERAVPEERSTVQAEGDRLLEEWAKWQRGGGASGYPTMEPFERLVTPSSGLPIGPMPANVAMTDRAVCILKQRHASILWAVIKQHYLTDTAIDVKAAKVGKSRAGFYRLLKRAQARVADIVLTLARAE